ncbi:hypothetical protein EDB19DRAFT_1781338 [Suillus lakei]|nr:hypothetical protein EDB19DRAFT_1781338 [Suillus lakei]
MYLCMYSTDKRFSHMPSASVLFSLLCLHLPQRILACLCSFSHVATRFCLSLLVCACRHLFFCLSVLVCTFPDVL